MVNIRQEPRLFFVRRFIMNGKVCFITGATSEIGKSIALRFAKEGCSLILHYHREKDFIQKIKKEIEEKYQVYVFLVQGNLEEEISICEMVDFCYKKYSQIDFLIHNAALCIDSLYEEKTKENFSKILDVNLIGTFLLSRKMGDKMYADGGGKIVILTSTNGIDKYFPMSLDYDASKAALISLMHNLAVQYAPKIAVNAVAPGWVRTQKEMEGLDEDYIRSEEEKIFLNRFAEKEEIANVVYFLCSKDASYINNTVIRVDGGTYHG